MNDVDATAGQDDGQAMGERKKEITGEEYLLIAIVLLQNLRAALTDPNTPNKITITEWMQIVQAAGGTAWEQYKN